MYEAMWTVRGPTFPPKTRADIRPRELTNYHAIGGTKLRRDAVEMGRAYLARLGKQGWKIERCDDVFMGSYCVGHASIGARRRQVQVFESER